MNQSVTIGGRLAEERKRKGLNQAAFAAIGGVSVKTQVLYEKAERVPDANYLAAIAGAGVDVLYVLTGASSSAALAAEEAAVLAGYRLLDARGRAGVLALIGGMQPDNGNAIVRVKGNVGQYVEGNVTAPFTIDMSKKKQP
ncbi:helix-turn-helix domain-containing protein [Cupriavidus basilensis]|uniref:helix-turn-helix domain-containing protein n=1 Tax=Cupriavidus basilensis TaxID=68895 RepID=UPI0005BAC509|nr:helix-turn-helix domain-containing protein [Cupriavidus basilensis]